MSEWTSGAVAEEAEEAEAADGKAERGARFASLFPFLLSLALLPPRRRRRPAAPSASVSALQGLPPSLWDRFSVHLFIA